MKSYRRVSIGESRCDLRRAAPESGRCFEAVGSDRCGLSSWIPCRFAAVYRYRFRSVSAYCSGIFRAQYPYFARTGTFPAFCAVIGQMYHANINPPQMRLKIKIRAYRYFRPVPADCFGRSVIPLFCILRRFAVGLLPFRYTHTCIGLSARSVPFWMIPAYNEKSRADLVSTGQIKPAPIISEPVFSFRFSVGLINS